MAMLMPSDPLVCQCLQRFSQIAAHKLVLAEGLLGTLAEAIELPSLKTRAAGDRSLQAVPNLFRVIIGRDGNHDDLDRNCRKSFRNQLRVQTASDWALPIRKY